MFVSTTEANTFTKRNLRRTIIDQRFQSATTLAIMKHRGRIKVESGGSIISQPILSQINQSAESYAGADPLNVDPQEEFTNYELQWKQAHASVVITNIDKAKNQGTEQSLSLIKAKQDSAMLSLFNKLATMLYSNGTGNGGKDWDGLLASVNDAAHQQVYLNIDRLANPWWQAQIFDPGAPTALSAGNMMTLYMATRTDEEVPDVITATKAGYQQYWTLLVPGERYEDDDIGNLGFNNICLQGVPLVEDSHQLAGQMHFLNLDNCRMVVHKDHNFRFKDFEEPNNQDVMIGHWFVYGNFEVTKPGSCGVFRNIQNG